MSGTDYSEDEARADRLLRRLSEHERLRASQPPAPLGGLPPQGGSIDHPRYEIREPLGEGATSVVYRAFDRELKREVAVKVSKDAVAVTPTARERFRREARAAAGLAHPNVITVYDAGEAQGRLFLVMERIEGRSLAEILKERPADERPLIELLEQASRGVAAAHANGIVHRDLKPGNILVTRSGEVKVGDFGLAHLADSAMELTRTGTPLGTPVYMPPEQVEGSARDITPRSDVYALGAILYEILSGRPPHVGESLPEVYRKILHEEPEPPKRSGDLGSIALKALEKIPERRYPAAGDFAEDLRRHLRGEPTLARPAGPVGRLVKRLRKRARALALGGTIAAAAAASAGLWWQDARRTERYEVEKREGATRYAQERDEAVRAMREMARTSVSAALNLRRKGATMPELRPFVQSLKATYSRAKERAPRSAEVEYLMGRMRRVVIDHDLALEHQNRALEIDPGFAPALYERVVLTSRIHSSSYWAARDAVRAEAGSNLAPDWLERAQRLNPKFAQTRQEIVRDLDALERALARGYAAEGLLAIGQAHLSNVKGILEFWTADYSNAQEHLLEAVKEDPLLEEAWELLASTLAQFVHGTTDPVEKQRRWQDAVDCFDQAIFYDRGYPRLWNLRAALHSDGVEYCRVTGRDPLAAFAAAERDATEACRLMPHQFAPWWQRANVRYKRALHRKNQDEDPREDLDEAERCVEEAIRFAGHAEAYSLRASIRVEKAALAERSNDRAGAESLYRAAIGDFEKAGSMDAALANRVASPLEEARRSLRALRP